MQSGAVLQLFLMAFVITVYEPVLVGIFGQTLGHKIMKIRVVNKDGQTIGFFRALIRYLAKLFLGIFSILSLMGSNQAIHDMLVKSYVVDHKR